MNRSFIAAALVAVTASGAMVIPAEAADGDVAIRIGEPGFYGRLDVDDVGNPSVINAHPSLDRRAPPGVAREPLYLRVPSSHRKNWHRFCANYGACDHPVYFVKDDWYNDVYAPQYRELHREDREYRDDRDDHNRNNRDSRDDHDDHHQQAEDHDPGKGRDHG
jgi:hypothetical protein